MVFLKICNLPEEYIEIYLWKEYLLLKQSIVLLMPPHMKLKQTINDS